MRPALIQAIIAGAMLRADRDGETALVVACFVFMGVVAVFDIVWAEIDRDRRRTAARR
jgi:predicted transcriptional regulator